MSCVIRHKPERNQTLMMKYNIEIILQPFKYLIMIYDIITVML